LILLLLILLLLILLLLILLLLILLLLILLLLVLLLLVLLLLVLLLLVLLLLVLLLLNLVYERLGQFNVCASISVIRIDAESTAVLRDRGTEQLQASLYFLRRIQGLHGIRGSAWSDGGLLSARRGRCVCGGWSELGECLRVISVAQVKSCSCCNGIVWGSDHHSELVRCLLKIIVAVVRNAEVVDGFIIGLGDGGVFLYCQIVVIRLQRHVTSSCKILSVGRGISQNWGSAQQDQQASQTSPSHGRTR